MQNGPWPEFEEQGQLGRPKSGEGEVREKPEEVEIYPWVVLDRVGGGWKGLPHGAGEGGGGELAPASSGGRGVCGRGCGASLDHGESVSGSSSGEGGLGKSAPRRV